MNEDLFAFHINYDQVYDPENLYPGVVEGLYNGNISETYWLSSTDNTLRKYGYRYDKLNRLKDAYFQQPFSMDHNCQSYNEHLSYDKNGNILTLNRQSRIENFPVAVEIDHLEYFYQGNQLTKVTDLSGYPQGFKDDSDGTNDDEDDYRYDAFGNMYKDENKQIVFITYNHLNLPVEIDFLNGSKISYLYNAAGQKLRKIVTDLGEAGGISTTEYLDGFQYNNAVLQFFSHPEGYVLNTPDRNGDPSFDYVYQYKDHLGNIRMNFLLYYPEGSFVIPHLRVLEENHYYPFGLKHENYNTERRKMAWDVKLEGGEEIDFKKLQQVPNSGYQYKYNGVELQDELGLNMYAMDMRQYDPAIARWVVQDPVVHFDYSPYSAFDNNPVFWADPSGADAESNLDSFGRNKTDRFGNFIPAYMRGEMGVVSRVATPQTKEGEKRTRKESHINALDGMETYTYVTQYYHSGGLNGSKSGWYSEIEYVGILYDRIKYGGLYGWNGGDNSVVGFAELVQYIASRVEYDQAYSATGHTVPMGFDSPFFIVGGVSRFFTGASKGSIVVSSLKNGHLAGKTHPVTGVPFSRTGFPDFTEYLYKGGSNNVIIKPTGNRALDAAAANKAAGYTTTPKGYTWHHHQTRGRMQLVESSIHRQTGHTGGFSLWTP